MFIDVFFQNNTFAHAAINNFRSNNHIQIKFCRFVHSYKMHSPEPEFFPNSFGFLRYWTKIVAFWGQFWAKIKKNVLLKNHQQLEKDLSSVNNY